MDQEEELRMKRLQEEFYRKNTCDTNQETWTVLSRTFLQGSWNCPGQSTDAVVGCKREACFLVWSVKCTPIPGEERGESHSLRLPKSCDGDSKGRNLGSKTNPEESSSHVLGFPGVFVPVLHLSKYLFLVQMSP